MRSAPGENSLIARLEQPYRRGKTLGARDRLGGNNRRSLRQNQWGSVQVNITLKTTIAGKKVTRRFTDLGGTYSYHTSRSQYIMSQALPILRQEFLAAQSAKIQNVSGATYTSQAFAQSLQSALLKAHA